MYLSRLWKENPELFGHYPGRQHHAKDSKEVEDMNRNGKWDQFIRRTPVKKGDFFQIEPGCLHAIKGGTLVFETQQNSDITYRVYDYDRLSGGKPRELHVQQSIDTIKAPYNEIRSIGGRWNQDGLRNQ